MIALLLGPAALGGEPPAIVLQQEGYFDAGWFDAQGDGVAYARDVAHRTLGAGPDGRYVEVPWVYYGDPWANAVNSQGDVADLGLDRTAIPRFDPIQSGGRPTFLVSRVHHRIAVDRGDQLGLRFGVNLEPRTGTLGSPGDVLSIDTAYLVWRPFEESDLKLYIGRLESGFGREYRYRHASTRIGITPSILSRYLVGLQTGVRVRGTVRRWLGYSLAITNGGTVREEFGHLANDLDANGVPTATARVGVLVRRPVRLEVGVSGQGGPQDGQPSAQRLGWQVGVDAHLDAGRLSVDAEGMIARAPGDPVDPKVERLDARGAVGTVQVRPIPSVIPYARVDWRDAELLAWPNLYVSDVLRVTAGTQVDVGRSVSLKAEYLHLEELAPGTDLRDDVFTTSVVFRYETRRMEL